MCYGRLGVDVVCRGGLVGWVFNGGGCETAVSVVYNAMPIIYSDPNRRRRYDAFRIIDESGTNPLSEAIERAKLISDPMDACVAWVKIAEFVYAKPKFDATASASPEESRRKAEESIAMIRELERDANERAARPRDR